jgi:hydroxymethylpyrimidine/phosphomethylpyrimidine kinase
VSIRNVSFASPNLITPNLDEARILSGRSIGNMKALRAAGEELVAKYRTAFLLKGGHFREEVATDLLITDSGEIFEFSAPFISGVSTHGTGCTYSAAIAAGLARGLILNDAVAQAKAFVTQAIAHFLRWEHPKGTTDALHHLAGVDTGASSQLTPRRARAETRPG